MKILSVLIVNISLLICCSLAQEKTLLSLPKPRLDGGMPLMQALKDRHTSRDFASEKISPQMLSNLLWAADGINRPDQKKRTAPSARNWQEIDLYVVTSDGVFVYDADSCALRKILQGDHRAKMGSQKFVGEAPLNIVYVANLSKTGKASPDDQQLYTAVDAGVIVQNVYLFCASEGLGCVVRGTIDRKSVAELFQLKPDQKVVLGQTVGFVKK